MINNRSKVRTDHLIDTDLIFYYRLYLFQISILLKHEAFVSDIPIVAAVAAEYLGLHANESDVHDLGKIAVGFAEIRQNLSATTFLCVFCNRTTYKMKSKFLFAVCSILRVYLL